MKRRQTMPQQWLIINQDLDPLLRKTLRELPHGSGILIIRPLSEPERRCVRLIAKLRGHTIAEEGRNKAVRIHNARELTRALTGRPTLVLLSPIYETCTHPGSNRLPRMQAAALARLCRRNAVALGGMNKKRYGTIAALGFSSWAGISAFRT